MSVDFRPEDGRLSDEKFSLNVSNGWAHAPVILMGLEGRSAHDGKIPIRDLESALACLRLSEGAGLVEQLARPDVRMGRNWIDCGRDMDDIRYYRDRMITIVEECIRRGVPLVWS